MMEGISSEAASLAGLLHLGLNKLTVFYDANHITLEGAADVEFSENVAERFDAYGWHVGRVNNVNDFAEIDRAIAWAVAETRRPSLIVVHSHIGYGAPVQDTAEAHGAPLGEVNVAQTRDVSIGRIHHSSFRVRSTRIGTARSRKELQRARPGSNGSSDIKPTSLSVRPSSPAAARPRPRGASSSSRRL